MSFLFLLLLEDILFVISDLSTVNTWEELISLPSFTKIVIYGLIILIFTISLILNFVFYRIMRPIALFIMARHAGFRYPWIAFVPYGSYYLEFVLPIREYNVFNWIKTDRRETIAWVYIGNDVLGWIVSFVISMIPFLGKLGNLAYKLFFIVYKWRRIYDLLKTYRFNKSAMTLSIFSVMCKPLYVILLFTMCDKEPDYGWGRYDFPLLLDADGEVIE